MYCNPTLFWQVKVKNRLYFCVYCMKMADKETKVSVCDFSVICDTPLYNFINNISDVESVVLKP